MTEKEHRKSVERLLVGLHAARAYLTRVESEIRSIIGTDISEASQDAPGCVLGAFYGADKENTHATPTNAVKGRSRSSDAKSAVFTQDDLFRDSTKMEGNNEKHSFSRRKGYLTLSRKDVLANFRRFASGKDLLDLADVNRILGFHRSTSGSFVRLAVQRGELGYVPVGKEVKFLPIDLRSFIDAYFRRQRKGN